MCKMMQERAREMPLYSVCKKNKIPDFQVLEVMGRKLYTHHTPWANEGEI